MKMVIKVTRQETYIVDVSPAEYCAHHADTRNLYDKLDDFIPDECRTSIDDIHPADRDSEYQLNRYIDEMT